MQLDSRSVHQPFFIKCPAMPHFFFFFLLPLGHWWKLVRKGGWATCGLGRATDMQMKGSIKLFWGGAICIISLFPVLNASSESSGLEQPGPRSVLPTAWCWRGGCLPSHVSLSAWRQGEQESPRADVQMETERVPPKGLPGLASAMPRLRECGR